MEKEIEKIQELLKQRRYSEAIAFITELLDNNPENKTQLLKLRSQAFLGTGYFDKAITDLKYLVEIIPNDEEIWISLSDIYRVLAQYTRAIEVLHRALEINPHNNASLMRLADLYNRVKNYNRAIELYQRVLLTDPDNVSAYVRLGEIYRQQKEFDKALELFQRALLIAPENIVPYLGMGILYRQRRDFDRALQFYHKAIQLQPNNIAALIELGVVYRQQNEYETAIAFFQKAISLNPNNVISYLELGKIFRSQNKFNEALEYFQKALQLKPNNSFAFLEIGDLYLQLHDYKNATDTYKKLLEINPINAVALSRLGQIYIAQGKSAEGVNLIKEGERIYQGSFEEEKGILRVSFSSSATISTIISFLEGVRSFYNLVLFSGRSEIIDSQLLGKSLDNYLPIDKQLYLNSAQISSPGFWEFLGSLNPLEQVREYLKDRHERKKDNNYKNEIEKKKGQLEIQQQLNKVILERVEILKSLGYAEDEIKKNYDKLISSIAQLAELENGQLISDISIIKK